MINTTRAMRAVAEEAHPLLQEWVGAERADALAGFIRERLENGRPTIMVYGIYNAGKSTLLNAMAGEEAATVSNRPETSVATPYRWRDFVILDTPGIDAPQEHEAISKRQLEQADVIVFVLDSTSTFEEERVYAELTDILSARKRTMVVVNDKTGIGRTGTESHAAFDKVLRNLQQQCSDRGIDDSLWKEMPLRMVDARTALKGRLEGKQGLIELSGIDDLERDLDRLLHDAGIGDVVNTVGHRLLAALKDAVELSAQTDDGEVKAVQEKRAAVAACRTALENNVGDELRRLVRRFQHEFPDAIRDEKSAEYRLREIVDGIVEGVVTTLGSELERTARVLTQQGIPFHAPSSEQMTSPDVETVEAVVTHPGEGMESNRESRRRDGLDSTADRIKNITVNYAPPAAEKALHGLKRVAPSVMKGVGPKTMAKWAGRLSGVLQAAFVIWDLGTAVRDYFGGDPEAKAAIREEKRLADIASEETDKLHASLERWCRDIVDTAFSPAEAVLRQETEALRKDEQGRATAHRELLNMTDAVERLL